MRNPQGQLFFLFGGIICFQQIPLALGHILPTQLELMIKARRFELRFSRGQCQLIVDRINLDQVIAFL